MENLLSAIAPGDPVWIGIAFVFGLAVRQFGLPPLVGFLLAGFALNYFGATGGQFLSVMADLGITLLLFSIGLKLRLNSLIQPEVWGVASIHMVVITLLIAGATILAAQLGLVLFSGLDTQQALLIGFVMSFSSTVFAIKILDEIGAANSRHGRIAIGVLVVQDIAAVIFLAASLGKVPQVWALALVLLYPMRLLLRAVMERCGHGELLILFGIAMALGGADVFEMVGVKGDVGALVMGMLLANHKKSSELAKALLGFKDLFLIGFFLSIGMTGLPGVTEFTTALVFMVLLPLKVGLFYLLFNGFCLRTSSSWRTSLNLATYSEFGLIVGSLAISQGWLEPAWLTVFAITLSLSFMVTAPFTKVRDHLYEFWRPILKRIERERRLPGDEDLDLAHVNAAVFGMGRTGTAAYKALAAEFQPHLIGLELDEQKTVWHRSQGRDVITGDITNPDFWSRAPSLIHELKWVALTLPTHQANVAAVIRLQESGYTGKIAATSKYDDQAEELRELGVDLSFNIYAEAGRGFADDLTRMWR